MQLFTGICSSDFINVFGIENGFEKIKQCGFDSVEIDLTFFKEKLLLDDKGLKNFFSSLKKSVTDNGLNICQTYISFDDEVDINLRKKLAERTVFATSTLGARFAVIEPIILGDAENTYVQNFKQNLEFYGSLKALAQNTAVKIAIPNTAGYNQLKKAGAPNACSSAGKILQLLDVLGDEFCACLDTNRAYYVGQRPCETAKILGEKLGRTVVDLDKEFTKTFNITPSDYITTYGEQAFRDKESEVVASVCKQSKLIIATGGGNQAECNSYLAKSRSRSAFNEK